MNCFCGGTHTIDTLLSCDLTIYNLGDKSHHPAYSLDITAIELDPMIFVDKI